MLISSTQTSLTVSAPAIEFKNQQGHRICHECRRTTINDCRYVLDQFLFVCIPVGVRPMLQFSGYDARYCCAFRLKVPSTLRNQHKTSNSAHHLQFHCLELAFEHFARQTAPFVSLTFEGCSGHPRWNILQNWDVINQVSSKVASMS